MDQMLFSPNLLGDVFLPQAESAPDLAAARKAGLADDEVGFLALVERTEMVNRRAAEGWSGLLDRLRQADWIEADGAVDAAIDALLSRERSMALVLKRFRRSADSFRRDAVPGVAALMDRSEEALVRSCEILRDARWDLMALRVERRPADAAAPLDLDALRKAVGLA